MIDKDPEFRRGLKIFLLIMTGLVLFMTVWAVTAYAILSHNLPGTWKLAAGGGIGSHGLVFHEDGTVLLGNESETQEEFTWHINIATPSQYWKYGTVLMMTIGDQPYGLSLGLLGRKVNQGNRLSFLPWSFHLRWMEGGGGEYIRVE